MPDIILFVPHFHRPKFGEKAFFFLSGIVIGIPFPVLINALVMRFFLVNLPFTMANVIITAILAPFLEEFAKAYALFYRHAETEKSLTSLGFYTGLGFGVTEFLLYVFVLGASPVIRLPLLFFHASNTAIVGYGVARKKGFYFYLFAVMLHFLNNLAATYQKEWVFVSAIVILVSYMTAIFLFRRAKEVAIDYL